MIPKKTNVRQLLSFGTGGLNDCKRIPLAVQGPERQHKREARAGRGASPEAHQKPQRFSGWNTDVIPNERRRTNQLRGNVYKMAQQPVKEDTE